jgi:hypothetical protein
MILADEVLSQALLYIGILATTGAIGIAMWLLLSATWATKKVRERQRLVALLSRSSLPARAVLPEADLSGSPPAPPTTSPSDRCDLYADLGDTAPQHEIADLEEPTETAVAPLAPAPVLLSVRDENPPKEEDFFDGDTQVEVSPLTASA